MIVSRCTTGTSLRFVVTGFGGKFITRILFITTNRLNLMLDFEYRCVTVLSYREEMKRWAGSVHRYDPGDPVLN